MWELECGLFLVPVKRVTYAVIVRKRAVMVNGVASATSALCTNKCLRMILMETNSSSAGAIHNVLSDVWLVGQ